MTGLYADARADDMVPGNADDLERLVARCRSVADGLGGAAARVRAIDAGEWVGPAGDAFRSVVDIEPGRFDDAAAAFAATGSAVRSYAAVLRDAQGSARGAVTLFEQAATATAQWEHREPRHPAYDPGEGDRRRAEAVLADARQQVADAGAAAMRAISAAWEHAPREPHWWESAGHFVAEIGRGAWEATAGLVEFAWSVSTVRMLVDPDGWLTDMQALGAGLVYGVTHPVELGKVLIDWDTWQESPGRAIGHLLPDLLLTLATAGGGAAARGARTMRALDEMTDVGTTFQRLDRLGESGQRLSYLQRARNVLSGEHLPPPNLAPDSPAGLAAGWQSSPAYPHADRWFNARLSAGDEIGAGSVSMNPDLRFSGFAVPRDVVEDVGTDAQRLYEGVQAQPWNGTYRDQLTVFRANADVDVAVSYALQNPQHGAGGLRQLYLPDMQQMIKDGVLEVVEQVGMENLGARVGPKVAAP